MRPDRRSCAADNCANARATAPYRPVMRLIRPFLRPGWYRAWVVRAGECSGWPAAGLSLTPGAGRLLAGGPGRGGRFRRRRILTRASWLGVAAVGLLGYWPVSAGDARFCRCERHFCYTSMIWQEAPAASRSRRMSARSPVTTSARNPAAVCATTASTTSAEPARPSK